MTGPSREPPWPPPAYAWYVAGVLTVAYVFSFIDRQILQLLVVPIRRDLQITDTQMSLLLGFSFAVFYTFFGIPMGRLADTRTRRNIIAGGIVFWSLMTAAAALARNFFQLLLVRVGVGAGEATLSPSAYSLLSDYFPPERRTTALSVYSLGVYLGGGLATLLGGLVVKLSLAHDRIPLPLIGEIRPWQMVFVIIGLAGGAYAAVLFTVREPVRRGIRAAEPASGASRSSLAAVLAYMRDNRATFLLHNLGFAILSLSGYGSGAWLATMFIRRHGWTASQAGTWIGAVTILFGASGLVAGGRLADSLKSRGIRDANLRVGLVSAAAGLPVAAIYCLSPDANLAAAMLAPSIFFAALPIAPAIASLQEIVPNELRGQTSAIFLFANNLIGLGLGPTAVALLTDYLFHDDNKLHLSILLVVAFAHAAGAAMVWACLRPYRASLEYLARWLTPGRG